jgi:hypothetical protein
MSHRRERKNAKKEKEYVYILSQYHCNDGKRSWDEYDPVRMIEKEVFEKAKKKWKEDYEKNFKKIEGGWYVQK